MRYAQSDVAVIKTVLLKHVRDAFVGAASIERQWRTLNYSAPPDFARAIDEYDRLVALLSELGVEATYLPGNSRTGLDSVYVRDASVVCGEGVILCNMGKEARRGEPAAQESALSKLGVRIHGRIEGSGMVEGGDVIWLDDRTIAVGRGYRTNEAGIAQLRELLGNQIDELIVVPLPHWRGPDDVFHLMSVLSPIDTDLALVYSPLIPVTFREELLTRGIELVEVPEAEFESMACNVLAVAPRKCVMLNGNPMTRRRLERAGAEVYEFDGAEICTKGAGGPTCLTRPIARLKS